MDIHIRHSDDDLAEIAVKGLTDQIKMLHMLKYMVQNLHSLIVIEGGVFSFALKHSKIVDGNFVDEEPLIYKEIPAESMLLELNPADTKPLPFGVYFYDIRVVMGDGYTDPFITGTLILTPEAH